MLSSASASSRSSSDYLINPPSYSKNSIKKSVIQKLDYLRYTSSAFMIAALVALVACAILIGLSQAGYLPPESPLYALCATAPLILISIAIDCGLRSYARKNNANPDKYFLKQRPDTKPKDHKTKKPT